MSNLERLRASISQTGPTQLPPKPPKQGSGGFGGDREGGFSARDFVAGWRAGLAQLDPRIAPDGWQAARWQSLCDDAVWLLGGYGDQAARDGWTSADLFGLWPDKPHWGGIADRLRGSRSLVLTAGRAHWRSFGVVERFNRGSYPDLRPFWEPGR